MGRLAPLVVVAALTISNAAAQNPPTPPCIPECANQVRADFAKFTCQNANDAACLCIKDNFFFGVRDCGAHCGANDDNVRQFLLGSFCAGHAHFSPGVNATVDYKCHTTYDAADYVFLHRCVVHSHNLEFCDFCLGNVLGSPQGTVIGIGIGVGAAVIALAGVVICFLLRGRKQSPRHSIEISKPLPGSGRAYAGRERNSFEKQGNDIEMTSHRYEDMVPRQQPRTMV
ncbi:hypothetical protein CDD80_5143 [Ophiocordyceps camponoti-rufipedis]|uniref:CFEM domain-containing protein n=1 Tax=Ophiocordyceps camponoti-rufipedis TaxID=2004952 RepID=A0A2C5YRZ8_9HYPO|nr:hypothetical protein CDD80_5143 [Ophiocordyceps camponoti-rufipedis]